MQWTCCATRRGVKPSDGRPPTWFARSIAPTASSPYMNRPTNGRNEHDHRVNVLPERASPLEWLNDHRSRGHLPLE